MAPNSKLKTQNSKLLKEAAWVLALLALAVTDSCGCTSPGAIFRRQTCCTRIRPGPQCSRRAGPRRASATPTQIDVSVITEPWLEYGAKRLHAGELPSLEPDNMLGAPFVGNDQSGIFYPVNWLYFLLPSPWMLGGACVGTPFPGGCRRIPAGEAGGAGQPGSGRRGGHHLRFGPFMISWLMWNLSTVVSWLPWLWWATARLFESTEYQAPSTEYERDKGTLGTRYSQYWYSLRRAGAHRGAQLSCGAPGEQL